VAWNRSSSPVISEEEMLQFRPFASEGTVIKVIAEKAAHTLTIEPVHHIGPAEQLLLQSFIINIKANKKYCLIKNNDTDLCSKYNNKP
jgi:hypothetical protein